MTSQHVTAPARVPAHVPTDRLLICANGVAVVARDGGSSPFGGSSLSLDDLGPFRWKRYLTEEAELFLRAGAAAARQLREILPTESVRVGIVCANSAAGLREYVDVCQASRTGERASTIPVRGPQSSFNSPATHLSLYLGAQGPCVTIAGDAASGLSALGFARTLLRAGRGDIVLAGAVDAPAQAPLDMARHDMARHDMTRHDMTRHDMTAHDMARHDLAGHDMAPGAGAAVLALAARPAGLAPLAQLGPVVTAPDRGRGTAAHATAAPVVARALAETGVAGADIDAVITSGPVSLPSQHEPVLRVEAMAGWTCAAGGALAVSAATEMIRAEKARHVLCVSADHAGACAAVVVSAPSWEGDR